MGIIFAIAVFIPSLLLAWLAIRSQQDQQFIVERQQALLCSATADALVGELNNHLRELQRSFALEVDRLLLDCPAPELATAFDDELRHRWPLAAVGFAASLDGIVYSPAPTSRPETRQFRVENDPFLSNRSHPEVYLQTAGSAPPDASLPLRAPPTSALADPVAPGSAPPPTSRVARIVSPQQDAPTLAGASNGASNPSRFTPAAAGFRELVLQDRLGTAARFIHNQLNVLFWYRPPQATDLVFGALLDLHQLAKELQPLIELEPKSPAAEFCVALLDDQARPVAVSRPGFEGAWARPFVAAELGAMLPQWELGLYLVDPEGLSRNAQSLAYTLGMLVLVLLLAIAVGGWLAARDLERQLLLARQKTDFVSNVSHELKTPLTSIRMFAELLAEGRVADPSKQQHYLGIITAEAARLTRLINNVLDFNRLDRGEKRFQREPADLHDLARETLDTLLPHLQSQGYQVDLHLPDVPVPVEVDRDAIAQVLVNLLSNAEKYSGDQKEIRIELDVRSSPVRHAELRVLDRGLGVPPGAEEKIFEQFYRAHDTLASGVQGSGLGLTLARRIARAHSGDVTFEPRTGGGSLFTLHLPLRPETP